VSGAVDKRILDATALFYIETFDLIMPVTIEEYCIPKGAASDIVMSFLPYMAWRGSRRAKTKSPALNFRNHQWL
jgi:hypothetical protein